MKELSNKKMILGMVSLGIIVIAVKACSGLGPGLFGNVFLAVLNGLRGPVGLIAGLTSVGFGAWLAVRMRFAGAVPALLGGGALLGIDLISICI